jgi:triphosphoribosyl-dephospho-CoA synthase
LTPDDTWHVYEAIRVSQAGGLGRSDTADVSAESPPNLALTDAMGLAADRDLVAKQYVNNFQDVFVGAAAAIEFGLTLHLPLESAILQAYLIQLAHFPDSLIQRKCGPAIAEEARFRAEGVLMSGGEGDGLGSEKFQRALAEFDRWLRADGHRRNPGTTADLIAAGLFVLLREGRLNWKVW